MDHSSPPLVSSVRGVSLASARPLLREKGTNQKTLGDLSWRKNIALGSGRGRLVLLYRKRGSSAEGRRQKPGKKVSRSSKKKGIREEKGGGKEPSK